MATLSSSEINKRISALDAKLAKLNRDTEALAYDAMVGDAEAAASLEAVRQEIQNATGERTTLFLSISEAVRREEAQAKFLADAERDQHMADAQTAAETLKSLAGQVDGMAETARKFFEEMRAADMSNAGTDAKEFNEALTIINEVAYSPPSDGDRQSAHDEAMASLQQGYGQNLAGDLDAARKFIQDLDKVAPGTIMSLERSGAGNDPRIIRKAIREAKRRGY